MRKTIDGLPDAGPGLRAKVYDKAREAIQRQIEGSDPTLPDEIAAARRDALEDAIRRTEEYYLTGDALADANFDEASSSWSGTGLLPVERQARNFVQFKDNEDGLIDVDVEAEAGELKTDPDAVDRHREVVSAAEDLLSSYSSEQIGANAAAGVLRRVRRLLEALGGRPEECRPGQLIPRGEALRIMLDQQERPTGDEVYDIPPLPEAMKGDLRLLVRSYNIYVALDPSLSARDEALMGPDAVGRLVSPDEGRSLVRIAVQQRILTQRSRSLIEEEADNAPEVPTALDRRSRRFSEDVKNFLRAALAKAWRLTTLTNAAIAASTATAAVSAAAHTAKWLIANEDWITGVFSENPVVAQIVMDLLSFLRTLPLSGF